mmetsp:Transcript_157425/g.504989  ORF Transcript_157425/g.504989 Transcript_157425/m.504989 type:complete len:622 (+) Transcript_157425:62-1927(+)
MARAYMHCEDSELSSIVAGEESAEAAAAATFAVRHKRRWVVGGVLGIGLASALVLWKTFGPCVPGMSPRAEESMVSLVEQYPTDLVNLAEAGDDLDSRTQWLAAASVARQAVENGPGIDQAASAKMQQAVDQAMKTEDPEEARKLVERAMARATKDSQKKRSELKQYIKSQRRSLKKKETSPPLGPSQQKQIASCVFDTLQLTSIVAGIAANINDASKTCDDVEVKDLMGFGSAGSTHGKVCSVNVFAIIGGIVSLTGTLASAADDCTATLIPNIDALCTVAVTGIITAVAGMGGASTLISAACRPKGWYHHIPEGVVPSNVGSNAHWALEKGQASPDAARRLVDAAEAPPRQLLFGGGKGSTATHCSVEIMNTMWALASAALSIDSAGNVTGPRCPVKNVLTGSTKPSDSLLYTVPEALCTVDVSGAIVGFLSAMTYIELAVVNCVDTINLGAICASGLTGLAAASAGVAQAGTGLWLACDLGQKKIIKKPLNLVRGIDVKTGWVTSLMSGGSSGVPSSPLGRRLAAVADEHMAKVQHQFETPEEAFKSQAEEHIAKLKRQFKTPEDAFKSIGYNMDDTSAPWRSLKEPEVDLQKLSSLVEERSQHTEGGIFGSSDTCSN